MNVLLASMTAKTGGTLTEKVVSPIAANAFVDARLGCAWSLVNLASVTFKGM